MGGKKGGSPSGGTNSKKRFTTPKSALPSKCPRVGGKKVPGKMVVGASSGGSETELVNIRSAISPR